MNRWGVAMMMLAATSACASSSSEQAKPIIGEPWFMQVSDQRLHAAVPLSGGEAPEDLTPVARRALLEMMWREVARRGFTSARVVRAGIQS
ncbi:MAG: hypothetical protein AAF409_12905 [Pseudomonadota bacterium]